ncbi:MAG: CAP domain-containing protein [Anaerolineales bacterium]
MLLKRSLIIWAGLALSACAVNPMTPPAPATLLVESAAIRLASVSVVGSTASPTALASLTAGPLALATMPVAEPTSGPEGIVVTAQVALVAVATQPPAQPTSAAAKLQAPPAATRAPDVAAEAPPAGAPPAEAPPPVSGDVAAAEQYTIDLINQRRAEAGLGPLARNETLMAIARGRVADMVARGYTGHDDPVTGVALGPAEMRAAGFSNVGENWFGSIKGPPAIADVAMGWFMTDAPHYRNILSTGYGAVGVGIAYNGHQWLLVQDFASP